jgi:RES domain-containing protein
VSVVAWRIVKRKFAKFAFSGDGARRFGGRWNSTGVPTVYTAQSQALAALEILVNVESAELLEHYAVIEVIINPSLITKIEISTLPRNWRADPPPARIRAIGDRWIAQGVSAVLQVPSSVIPSESNFLLNPRHPDFQELQIGKPTAFRFDMRLT